MSEPSPKTAPACTRCGRIYLEGAHGICSACRQASRRTARAKKYNQRKRHAPLTCQCGQPAVTVLTVRVGRQFDGFYTVRIPLCRTCLDLEKAMWDEQLPDPDDHAPLVG